jgi:deferrochelatase/peroxidase EfeB
MTKISRRTLIGSAGGLAVGSVVGRGFFEPTTATPPGVSGGSGAANLLVPFRGEHQAGVTTAPQARAVVASFDLTTDSRSDVIELMRRWTEAAEEMTSGREVAAARGGFASTTGDSGEALGLGPARLTVTFGFGEGLFVKEGQDRYGLATLKPEPLVPIPHFSSDELDPSRSGGDLCVQACADDPTVAFHAVRNLVELARGAAVPRWAQLGFGRTSGLGSATPRNLMGFKDGTNNLDPTDEAQMRNNVWVDDSGPRWMKSGTYMVVRRIRMRLEHWDTSAVTEQERTIGRYKVSGAPLGEKSPTAAVNPSRLPQDAHIIQANPRTAGSERERILRRGYSFVDGIDPDFRELEAGLLFVCFQQDPRRQFIAIQQRLDAHDHLSEYVFHTGSAMFAIPPGARPGAYVGETLLTQGSSLV